MKRCQQCNGPLKGYYDFYVCSACYTENVNAKQRELLKKEKQNEHESLLSNKSKTSAVS